jgi:pheromone shutdown-related protein TraB
MSEPNSQLAHQDEFKSQIAETQAEPLAETSKLSSAVTVLQRGERTFYLVGTAHISAKSVVEVRETIEAVKPDSVCVELCNTRFQAMNDPDRWKKLDIFQVIKQGKMLYFLANLALSAYQTALGEKFGVKPGEEQREGIRVAKEANAELVLADRDIQATLKRTWANIGFWSKLKLLGSVFAPAEEAEELTEAKLEEMKDKDTITEMMREFAKTLPEIKTPLIDERDQYLIQSVISAPGNTVVAVVGAGHVEGMVEHFNAETAIDLEALSIIPPTPLWVKSLKWIIPSIILGAFYVGYQNRSGESFEMMLTAWILPNAVMAALLSLIALPKPLSVLTAAIASPITSLNPALGAGMVVGLVEAWLRKPTVADSETLVRDAATIKGMYKNPFSRVLLVAVFATMGSALGAYIGFAWVLSLF